MALSEIAALRGIPGVRSRGTPHLDLLRVRAADVRAQEAMDHVARTYGKSLLRGKITPEKYSAAVTQLEEFAYAKQPPKVIRGVGDINTFFSNTSNSITTLAACLGSNGDFISPYSRQIGDNNGLVAAEKIVRVSLSPYEAGVKVIKHMGRSATEVHAVGIPRGYLTEANSEQFLQDNGRRISIEEYARIAKQCVKDFLSAVVPVELNRNVEAIPLRRIRRA